MSTNIFVNYVQMTRVLPRNIFNQNLEQIFASILQSLSWVFLHLFVVYYSFYQLTKCMLFLLNVYSGIVVIYSHHKYIYHYLLYIFQKPSNILFSIKIRFINKSSDFSRMSFVPATYVRISNPVVGYDNFRKGSRTLNRSCPTKNIH